MCRSRRAVKPGPVNRGRLRLGRAGRDLAGRCRRAERAAGGRRARDDGSQPLDGGGPGARPPVLGQRSGLHPRDDQPRRTGRGASSGRAAPQGRDRLLGQQLPHVHAQPDLPRGATSRARSRWSTGRSSRCRSASRRRPVACRPPSRDRWSGRPWRRTTRSASWTHPFGPLGLLSRWRPTWHSCTPPRPTPPATWCSPSRSSTACGAPGPPVGAWWPPWSGSSTTSRGSGHRVRVPGPPGAGRRRGALRRPSGRVLRAGPARTQLRRGHRALERSRRRRLQERVRRLRAGLGAGSEDTRGVPGPRRHRAAALAGGTVGPDVVEGGRRRPSRRRRSQRDPMGAGRLAREPERWSVSWPRSAPTRCWPGAGVANLAAWVAVGRARASGTPGDADRRAGSVGLPAHAGRSLHLQPAGLSRPPPTCPTPRPCWGWSSADPGTRTVGCLGAAEVDRHGSLNSTELAGGRFLVGSGGANDVASRATACVVVTLARPERLPEAVSVRDLARAARRERRDRQGHSAALTTGCCGWRPCPPATGRPRSACAPSSASCGYEPDGGSRGRGVAGRASRRGPGVAGVRPAEDLLGMTLRTDCGERDEPTMTSPCEERDRVNAK